MNIHLLQHVDFEGAGSIAGFARRHGHTLTTVKMYKNSPLPEPDSVDALVVMGGPMSVNDESEYPWLTAEKKFISRLIEQKKPILGICLGAQMIASSLGARVYPGPEKEIGWFPVHLAPEAKLSTATQNWPENPVVFHWHGETFDLPAGSVRIASSDLYKNQAFIYGDRVIGIQFHLEMGEEDINRIITHCGDEITKSPYIQSPQVMAGRTDLVGSTHKMMDSLLIEWIATSTR